MTSIVKENRVVAYPSNARRAYPYIQRRVYSKTSRPWLLIGGITQLNTNIFLSSNVNTQPMHCRVIHLHNPVPRKIPVVDSHSLQVKKICMRYVSGTCANFILSKF